MLGGPIGLAGDPCLIDRDIFHRYFQVTPSTFVIY
jgi:hypothetical protein